MALVPAEEGEQEVLGRRGRRRRTGRSKELGRRSGLAQITEDDWFVASTQDRIGAAGPPHAEREVR